MRLAVVVACAAVTASAGFAQQSAQLTGRWVGTLNNQSLHLDFYGDTMVVVNDRYALNYRATYDSVIVWGSSPGDTAFAVRYWFSMDRLLLQTVEGKVVTLSQQDLLARPIDGRWRGSPVGKGEVTVELRMSRGGIAQRRVIPGGAWVQGEWERRSRNIRFTWLPDSIVWMAYYDPLGEALLFDSTEAEIGTLVVRKVYR